MSKFGKKLIQAAKEGRAAVSDNPKNLAAMKRIKPALLPAAGVIHGATACMLGVSKYGPYNWRDRDIALMEYCSAIIRHVYKFIDGQDYDEEGVHALGCVIAGAAIMLDAIETGKVIDDRPRAGPAAKLLHKLTKE